MATVQSLKKKLQTIRSTAKVTRAMKTASTVKYSRLSGIYAEYEKYSNQYLALYESYRKEFNSAFSPANPAAPCCYVVMTSDKGMCGAFNSELLSFFAGLPGREKGVVISCGKKGRDYCEKKGIVCEGFYDFGDIPSYEQVGELFDRICALMSEGKISSVRTVYPEYTNMMKQTPVCKDLFNYEDGLSESEAPLFVPDRETVIKNTAESIFLCVLYKRVLETALGAQAATLTAMRSAYDTACEYSARLETEMNRKRQSQVTADVIEISSEFSMKGDM